MWEFYSENCFWGVRTAGIEVSRMNKMETEWVLSEAVFVCGSYDNGKLLWDDMPSTSQHENIATMLNLIIP